MFKTAIETPEPRQLCRSGIFTVNFEYISHFFKFLFHISIDDFEQVYVRILRIQFESGRIGKTTEFILA